MPPRAHELLDSSCFSISSSEGPSNAGHNLSPYTMSSTHHPPYSSNVGGPEDSENSLGASPLGGVNQSDDEDLTLPFFQRCTRQYIPPTQFTPDLSDYEQSSRSSHSHHKKATYGPQSILTHNTACDIAYEVGSCPDNMADAVPCAPDSPLFAGPLSATGRPWKDAPTSPTFTLPPLPNPPAEQRAPVAVMPTDISGDFSTPMKQRLLTSRPHDDQRRLKAQELIPLLRKELSSDMNVSQTFTFVDLLFPSSGLPFPIDDATLDALEVANLWNKDDACFCTWPTSFSERDIAQWLNYMGMMIGAHHKKTRVRWWYAGTRNLSPAGSPHVRKPDIVLLDQLVHENMPERIHWTMIRAFAEVTAQHPFPKRILEMVNEKSYLMFITQDEHCFVPALSFDGSGCFSLTITDCQGQIRMSPMSLFVPGKDVALLMLRILVFFIYGKLDDIGIDPSIYHDNDRKVQWIDVNKKQFHVVKRIYSLQALIGWGTKVWLVK